jgi:hypothetical protein
MPSVHYGWRHQQRRAALLPYAYGRPCPFCHETMYQGQALDLDHSVPVSRGGTAGDRIAHASCNRRAGARLNTHPARPQSRTW